MCKIVTTLAALCYMAIGVYAICKAMFTNEK